MSIEIKLFVVVVVVVDRTLVDFCSKIRYKHDMCFLFLKYNIKLLLIEQEICVGKSWPRS